MKLIMIHGRSQEDYDEQELKQTWVNSLAKGLEKSGLKIPKDIVIEFPYYGKLLKQLVDDTQKKVNAADGTRSGGVISKAKEIQFFEDFLGEVAEGTDMSKKDKEELKQIREKDRGPLNWEIVQKFFSFFDSKGYFATDILRKFTLDVFMYLSVNDIKNKINQKVESCFDQEPCLVVGHSLGSIVSYIVLNNNPDYNVKNFITVGSPLGLKSIEKYLGASKRMPECIKNGWYNAYDERDFVALKPLDRVHFNIRPAIENYDKVLNFTDNRHGIAGYLEDKIVSEKIYQGLSEN